jgi:hypothetical protein
MDAITTARLVLGIATKGEPKPVLGQGVVTSPNLGPPLLGLNRY